MLNGTASLRRIKALHTMVWAGFVACIVAIPALAWQRRHGAVLALVIVVLGECAVLAVNQ